MNIKEDWIIEYLTKKATFKFVDMLDEDFVNGFIEQFNVQYEGMIIGASKCKELSKLLSSMYKTGLLKRFPHGVRKGLLQDGRFPKWVYSYQLP